jgi:hypothetical protein
MGGGNFFNTKGTRCWKRQNLKRHPNEVLQMYVVWYGLGRRKMKMGELSTGVPPPTPFPIPGTNCSPERFWEVGGWGKRQELRVSGYVVCVCVWSRFLLYLVQQAVSPFQPCKPGPWRSPAVSYLSVTREEGVRAFGEGMDGMQSTGKVGKSDGGERCCCGAEMQ